VTGGIPGWATAEPPFRTADPVPAAEGAR
jgi:hypothetical protein